ncbi:MAG: YheT family hydrolase [Polyangiaceae bacterium]
MTSTSLPPFVQARGLGNAYVQTAYPVLVRRPRAVPVVRERWETPDGDFLDVDICAPEGPARGFLVLLHGLEGSTHSGYVRGSMVLARARGIAAIGLNFRTCGGEPNRLVRTYHSGETGDAAFVVARAIERWPGLPGAVCGFSLGANVALKWMGEEGDALPAAIRGGVAVSCPFDLARCAARLDALVNWPIREHFLLPMRRKAAEKARRFPGRFDARAAARATTLRAFDDAFTAPVHGFRDAEDYWRRASSAPFLAAIARPALIVQALDDPLIPEEAIPRAALAMHRHVKLEAHRRGGHVGFVHGSALSPRYWAEERAIEFVGGLLGAA